MEYAGHCTCSPARPQRSPRGTDERMRLTDANQAAVAVQTRRRTPSAQSHQKTLSGGVATCPHGATGRRGRGRGVVLSRCLLSATVPAACAGRKDTRLFRDTGQNRASCCCCAAYIQQWSTMVATVWVPACRMQVFLFFFLSLRL